MKRIEIDPDWLVHQYEALDLNTYEISSLVPCSPSTVQRRLHEIGVHVRDVSEAKQGSRHPNFGKHRSAETKLRISKSNTGKSLSAETRRKISESRKGVFTGKNHPLYGIPLSEETKQKISTSMTGKLAGVRHPLYGKHHSPSARIKMRNAKIGMYDRENNPNWRGGKSFEPYCQKFDNELRERIREKFDHKCFLCGKPENGRKLSVHHTDYNKGQGCGHSWGLVPLCISCHMKTNYNRWYWFAKLNSYWAQNPDINFEVETW